MKKLLGILLVLTLCMTMLSGGAWAEEAPEPVILDIPLWTEPAVEEEPVIEEKPTVEEEPVVEEEPTVEEEPVIEDEPTGMDGTKDYGTCGADGADVSWIYDSNTDVLTISGTGAIADYGTSESSRAPWFKYAAYIKTVKVESGVTSVGKYAFDQCKVLNSVSMADTVESIGSGAFRDCIKLSYITVPESVKTLGSSAFYNCGLKSIAIPEGVEVIAAYAFYSCGYLASVTIPDGVTTIEAGAFGDCTALKKISLPPSIAAIEEYAFDGSGLASIWIEDLAAWCAVDIQVDMLTIGDSYRLANSLYLNGALVTDLVIPEGVTAINELVFNGFTCIQSVKLPKSLEKMSFCAFYKCTGLKTVILPEMSPPLGNYAFYGCTGLENVIYCGSAGSWALFNHGSGNDPLTSAPRSYHSYGEDGLCEYCGAGAYLAGDVNGDKTVNAKDAVRLAQYVLDDTVTVNREAVNPNGDSAVNILDVIRLMRYLTDSETEVF